MFSKVLTYFILVGSVVLVLLSLFIDDIVKIKIFNRTIIHPDFWIGLDIIPIILLAYLFNGIYINFTAGIFIEGKTKYIPYVTGAGALVNVVFNYLLIPAWGIMGAAYATLASYIVMAAGLYFVSQKFYPIKYENKKIILIFVSLLLVGFPYYLIAQGNIIYKLILLIFFMLLLFIFKLVRVDELKNIVSMFRFRGKGNGKTISDFENIS
jgi:O-antigen/teichoic acid export membrane protein